MNKNRQINRALKVFAGAVCAIALMLTFTVADYYIFNRFGSFNWLFILSQWVKKAGFLLLVMAAFFNSESCADIAKYILPVFTLISLFTYGEFFDITMLTDGASPAEKVYAHINEFISPDIHKLLFFLQAELILGACGLIFVRDGFKVSARSFVYAPAAAVAVTPLNFFENFYDKTAPQFGRDSFLWFRNFTVWHFLAIAVLAAATIGVYYFLKNKPRDKQDKYLAALAVILLIHYHSKDSVIMGDGYNVYHTVFACIPLFICNIGVYVACLSVFFKKRTLYSLSFFVHAAGALTVFAYFGRDDLSNYGVVFSYSILFFCTTHCILFVLSLAPSMLGHYKFTPRDAVIPLIYYCAVIVIAAVASAVVTSASMGFSYDGYTLAPDEWLYPNYAFTQKNPIPIREPYAPFTIWRCEMNWLYLIILYAVYVGLFYAFNGCYYAFLAVRRRILHASPDKLRAQQIAAQAEAAATDDENTSCGADGKTEQTNCDGNLAGVNANTDRDKVI